MFALILFSLFSDHLVLQRGRANPVWGTDTPAQTVTLKIEGSRTPTAEVSAVAGPDGKWILACPALPAGGPYRLHFHGSTDRVIDDVWVGDVWLASGQSNMEFPLNRARDAAKEITAANFPEIRFAKVARTVADSPATNANVGWEVCTPKNAGQFSAVGYFFARKIFETE